MSVEAKTQYGPTVKDLFLEATKDLKEDKIFSAGGEKTYAVNVDDDIEGVRLVTLASLGSFEDAYYLDDNIIAAAYVNVDGSLESIVTVNNQAETIRILSLLSRIDEA